MHVELCYDTNYCFMHFYLLKLSFKMPSLMSPFPFNHISYYGSYENHMF